MFLSSYVLWNVQKHNFLVFHSTVNIQRQLCECLSLSEGIWSLYNAAGSTCPL